MHLAWTSTSWLSPVSAVFSVNRAIPCAAHQTNHRASTEHLTWLWPSCPATGHQNMRGEWSPQGSGKEPSELRQVPTQHRPGVLSPGLCCPWPQASCLTPLFVPSVILGKSPEPTFPPITQAVSWGWRLGAHHCLGHLSSLGRAQFRLLLRHLNLKDACRKRGDEALDGELAGNPVSPPMAEPRWLLLNHHQDNQDQRLSEGQCGLQMSLVREERTLNSKNLPEAQGRGQPRAPGSVV